MGDYIRRDEVHVQIERALRDGLPYHRTIDEIHSVDVRPVVLCKDCREYDNTGYDTPEFGYCRCLKKTVQDCFYCAHGERQKDENKEE